MNLQIILVSSKPKFNIIDLFAGPGGLAEGFNTYKGRVSFKTQVSVEMNHYACETLRGRKAFLEASENDDQVNLDLLKDHWASSICQTSKSRVLNAISSSLSQKINNIVLHGEMGTPKTDFDILTKITKLRESNNEIVLVGGPPCQAYSMAGRVKNAANPNYDATKDKRNYLYQEYLKFIGASQPAVFVMENVKGLLSAKIEGASVFNNILNDLQKPINPFTGNVGANYKIYSLVKREGDIEQNIFGSLFDAKDFLVKAEDYGIPQARHRVILLGVRNDITKIPKILEPQLKVSVKDAIDKLPELRPSITDRVLSDQQFNFELRAIALDLAKEANNFGDTGFSSHLLSLEASIASSKHQYIRQSDSYDLFGVYNHYSRKHMLGDIKRYFYVSSFADFYGRSPRGHHEFPYEGLAPDHKNWKSNKFVDRFRCQVAVQPANTVTSHISKDGHHFIHYDPIQARSLSVREAARVQTFTDEYFFSGPQTAQYQQVGNAVPPELAKQIAAIVDDLLN